MSKEIDEKVVQMRFDNQQFENGVKTSMSTLDKLKKSLHLDGASKGFENVDKAARKVNFSPLSNGLETVKMKFSALEVMGITALSNLTNSAVNAGKRIASSLTIEPVRTGFNEYELKMNSVQTIMASTGESIESVNKYLNELNEYSDKTIYSFADMTQNIGKFTNAGVKLDDAVLAMKGISNEAALSGANANEASRAMYNLAQSISMGYVQLIDWKSIENANMATVGFKEQLLNTAVALGAVSKAADGYTTSTGKTYNIQQMFKDGLKEQWLTTDVLIDTLRNYADETTEIGAKAAKAATEVKTFTMMLDTLKEAAQSGWAQTWELVFGDFEEGKTLWTSIGNAIGDVIDKMSDARNNLLRDALGKQKSKWDELTEKIENAGISMTDFQKKLSETAKEHGIDLDKLIEKEGSLGNALKKVANVKDIIVKTFKKFTEVTTEAVAPITAVTEKLEDFQNMVNRTIRGDFGEGAQRYKEITDAGYDYYVVQKLVNKVWARAGYTWNNTTITVEDLTEAIGDMSDAELKNVGFTDEQIKKIQELSDEIKDMPIDEFLKKISKPSGRELLFQSLKDVAHNIKTIFTSIKDAWRDVFPATTAEQLYSIVETLQKFTAKLRMSDDTASKLKSTFKGLFAVLDLIRRVVSGVLKTAFGALSGPIKKLTGGALDLTAGLGNALSRFRDFIVEGDYITKAIKSVINWFKKLINKISEFFKTIAAIPTVRALIDKITSSFNKFKDVGVYAIEGLKNGLKDGFTSIPELMTEIGIRLVDAIKNVLGIHSPSRVLFAVGGYAAMGLIFGFEDVFNRTKYVLSEIAGAIVSVFNGVKDGVAWTYDGIKKIVNKLPLATKDAVDNAKIDEKQFSGKISKTIIDVLNKTKVNENQVSTFTDTLSGTTVDSFKTRLIEGIKNIKFDTIVAGGIGASNVIIGNKFLKVAEAWSAPLKGVGEVLTGFARIEHEIARPIAKVIKNTAKVVKSFSKMLKGVAFKMYASGILDLASAIGILVTCLVALTYVNQENLNNAVNVIITLAAVLAALAYAVGKMSNSSAIISKEGLTIQNGVSVLLGIAAALLLVALSFRMIAKLQKDQIINALGAYVTIVVSLLTVAVVMGVLSKKHSGDIASFGVLMLKMGSALYLLARCVKLLGEMEIGELIQGGIAVVAFTVLVSAMAKITKKVGTANLNAFGNMVIKISAALLLMIFVIKILGSMEVDVMAKGYLGILAFTGIITLLALTTKLISDKDISKLGTMMLGVGSAMLLMSLSVAILGSISTSTLAQGLVGVTVFAAIISALAYVASSLKDDAPKIAVTLLAMSVSLAIIAGVSVMLGMMSIESLAKGITAVSILGLVVSGMAYACKGASDCKGNLIVLTVAISLLAVAVYILSSIETDKLMAAAVSLGIVMTAFGVALFATSQIKDVSKTAMGALILLTAVVAVISIAIKDLATANPGVALPAAIGLSILLVTMTGVLYLLSLIGEIGKEAIVGIVALSAMALPLYLFSLVLSSMSGVQGAIQNAIALSVLITACSLMMPILALMGAGPVFIAAILGVGALTAMVVPMIVFINALKKMEGVKDAEKNIALIGAMMLILSSTLVTIGLIAPLALVATVALATIAAFIPGLVLLLTILGGLSKIKGFNEIIKNGGETLALIGTAIGNFVGSLISGFAVGLTGISAIAVELSNFAVGLQPFMDIMSELDSGILANVKTLAESVLLLTGSSILDGLSKLTGGGGLESFAYKFPLLGIGLRGFIDAVGEMDVMQMLSLTTAANAVKSLAQAASEIPNSGGLLADIVGDNDMGKFAEQFPRLGRGIKNFLNAIGSEGLTSKQLATVRCASGVIKTLAEAAKEIPNSGGLLGDLVGNNDLGPFADQFPNVGTGIRDFLTNIGENGLTDEEIDSVEAGANMIKKLAEAAKEIPNSGGLLGDLVGNNDLGPFADMFPNLGAGIKGYLAEMPSMTDQQKNSVKKGAEVLGELAKAAASIPVGEISIDSFMGAFNVERETLSKFSDTFPEVGKSIKGFCDNVGTFDTGSLSSLRIGIQAVQALSQLGAVDIESAADGIEDLTPLIGEFGVQVHEMLLAFSKDLDSETIANSVSQLTNIGALMSSICGMDFDGVAKFNTAATRMKTAIESMANTKLPENSNQFIGTLRYLKGAMSLLNDGVEISFTDLSQNMKTAVEDYKEVFDNISEFKFDNVSKFTSAIKQLSNTEVDTSTLTRTSKSIGGSINTIIQTLPTKISSSESDAIAEVENIIKNIAKTIRDSTKIQDAFSEIIKSTIGKVRTNRQSFVTAGSYLVSGLLYGVTNRGPQVYNAGYDLGRKLVNGLNNGIDSCSPSKEAIKSGHFFDEGLIVGVKDMEKDVYNTSYGVGETAVKSLSDAISHVGDVVSGDINLEPTIRPVLDLSDVRDSGRKISGMLGTDNISLRSNINAINGFMADGQNDTTGDVVRAIDKLRSELGNVGNTSYTVNGVTYDDGSNVSDAVRTLIRAVKVERRT